MDDDGQMAHGVANERTQHGEEEGENWQIPSTVGSDFDKGGASVYYVIMGGGSQVGDGVQNIKTFIT